MTFLLLALLSQDPIRDYAMGETDQRPDVSGADWMALHERLRSAKLAVPGKAGEEQSHTHKLSNGHEATFFYYVPKSYDPAKPTALVLFLHGGVSAPQPRRGKGQWQVWKEDADRNGWIACSPSGTDQCVWWKPSGVEHVLEAVRFLAARFAIDRNRVYLSGFSDGASGAYYFGMRHTDTFAACVPWNGAIGVVVAANGGTVPYYVTNCKTLAWRATHGGKDQLYPSSSQKPVIDHLKSAGVRIEWKDFEDVEHDGAKILGGDAEFIAEWLPKQVRDPLPAEIDWTADDPARAGRAYWIRILEIGDRAGDPFSGEKDPTLPISAGRPMLGVQIDQRYTGTGVKVIAVTEGSGAAEAGLQADDVITSVQGQGVDNFDELRAELSKLKGGETVKVVVTRNGMDVEASVPFRALKFDPPPAPGRLRATRKGNEVTVLAKRVARFEILVSPDAFDLSKEIVVTVNGAEAFRGKVTAEASFVLEETRRRGGDATVPYVARVPVEIAK